MDIAEQNPGSIGPLDVALDNVLAAAHNLLTGMEGLRVAAGAGGRALKAERLEGREDERAAQA